MSFVFCSTLFTGWLSSCPAVQLSDLPPTKLQVHVDEKNPSMFRELSQWVDDEGLEHAVDIFSEFLVFSGSSCLESLNLASFRFFFGLHLPRQGEQLRLNIVRGGPNMLQAELQGKEQHTPLLLLPLVWHASHASLFIAKAFAVC